MREALPDRRSWYPKRIVSYVSIVIITKKRFGEPSIHTICVANSPQARVFVEIPVSVYRPLTARGLPEPASPGCPELMNLRVLRLGSDEDGNVGVGVFPQREEILIRGPGFDGVALQRVGAG